MADEEKVEIPSRTPDQLKKLVLDFCDNKIFTSWHIADKYHQVEPQERKDELIARDLEMVFMPIALGGLSKVNIETIGLIFEYWSAAGPRSINGMPTFTSLHIINRRDWDIVRKTAGDELKRRQNIDIKLQGELDLKERKDEQTGESDSGTTVPDSPKEGPEGASGPL